MTTPPAASRPIRRAAAALAAALLALGPAAAPAKPASAKTAPAKAAPAKTAPAKPAPAKTVGGVAFSSDYRFTKPRNDRKTTKFIILHTTEGTAKGSLEKLSANGECHYVVDTDGTVYSIVPRGKIAYHCGKSMWNGETRLDNVSVGIEIVGWHDREITDAQYASVRKLLAELKKKFKVPDERVLTHSMVAYGEPNHWQKQPHRGRKRCGMRLALPAARTRLGLAKKPGSDPDLKAGRLKDADPELTKILYTPMPAPAKKAPAAAAGKTAGKPAPGQPAAAADPPAAATAVQPGAANVIGPKRSAWDIARDLYAAPTTLYAFPDGTTKRGDEISNWNKMPAGTVVTVGQAASENVRESPPAVGEDGTAQELAGDAMAASTTFWFPPSKPYAAGSTLTLEQIAGLPAGTKVLVGYRCGGPVAPKRPAFSICGTRWNKPDTWYWTKAGGLVSGDSVTDRTIPKGAMVFFPD